MQNIRAEVQLPTSDLQGDIGFFTTTLGFRMEEIFPADDPAVVTLQGYGLRLRLDRESAAGAGVVRMLCDDPMLIAGGATELTAPGGTRVDIVPLAPPIVMPPVASEWVVRRLTDSAPWVVGRAGMQYRDLIPSRLGGAIIASHIRIPDGGPVPDMVHYHSIGFQLIFCYKGWVDLVYEDQGPPFRLTAGNCVIQPPGIRHRVLYASADLEVIEIGVPADHITTIDHALDLPTDRLRPDRTWDGQRFVHFQSDAAPWGASKVAGYAAQDTTIGDNTNGVAQVHVLRPDGKATHPWTQSDDIYFGFVLAGALTLTRTGQAPQTVTAGDAFVVPSGMDIALCDPSDDAQILQVTLPALGPGDAPATTEGLAAGPGAKAAQV
ncbi:MAG: cupin domain-containing protein [Pseudomonadota bacterium]